LAYDLGYGDFWTERIIGYHSSDSVGDGTASYQAEFLAAAPFPITSMDKDQKRSAGLFGREDIDRFVHRLAEAHVQLTLELVSYLCAFLDIYLLHPSLCVRHCDGHVVFKVNLLLRGEVAVQLHRFSFLQQLTAFSTDSFTSDAKTTLSMLSERRRFGMLMCSSIKGW